MALSMSDFRGRLFEQSEKRQSRREPAVRKIVYLHVNNLIMPQDNLSKAFLGLVDIMDTLREKCPWDKKQTIHSLRSNTIEELYELIAAIID